MPDTNAPAHTPVIDLTGKVALITGGAGGQGLAHARLLTALGAKVVLTDLDEQAVLAAARAIGGHTIGIAHDVSSTGDWKAVAERVRLEHGTLDILVNNAGLCAPMAFEDVPEQVIRATINVNLIGVMLGMQLMLPLMREAGGSIINISSTAGLRGYVNLVHYAASKWGVIGASKSAALEYGVYGIRVNTICPGAIDTQMASDDTREGRGFITRIPVPRIGRPEEVSTMVAFLASDAASYCTGHEFTVDGGQAA